jgi:hypothetical protein
MKNLKIILFIAFLIIAINCNSQSKNFKIISEKVHVDARFGYNKCNLIVELNTRKSKAELMDIANDIRSTRKKYSKLWISYYVFGIKDHTTSWASTNFTPDLNVEILGASEEEIRKMNSVPVPTGKIGKWQDERPLAESGIILFTKDNKVYMRRSLRDGSFVDKEFVKKSQGGKIIFMDKNDTNNGYFSIEKNGNLGMYGESGKYSEAIVIH